MATAIIIIANRDPLLRGRSFLRALRLIPHYTVKEPLLIEESHLIGK